MITRVLLLAGALLVFGAVNWQIAGKERLRTHGQTMYLALTPVDPRSLLQGDYMALNFAAARSIRTDLLEEGRHYLGVFALDERRVGTFVRMDNGRALNPGELRFRFRVRNGSVWLGTNAFFFQEGDSDRYSGARFGEFRVGENGEAMLVDLRGKNLEELRAPLPETAPL